MDLLEQRSLLLAQRQGGAALVVAGTLIAVLGLAIAVGMMLHPGLMAMALGTFVPVGGFMIVRGGIRRGDASARLRELDVPTRGDFPAARLLE